jgi:hypothetical protein
MQPNELLAWQSFIMQKVGVTKNNMLPLSTCPFVYGWATGNRIWFIGGFKFVGTDEFN